MESEGVSEPEIMREGDTLILLPVRPSWQTLLQDLSALGPPDPDFLAERPDVIGEGRLGGELA